MTTISSSSTLTDVLTALNTRTVSTTGWSAITTPADAVTFWSATVGLFGDDLTTFFANCATVGYTKCNPAAFAAYSGWAVGV